MDTPKRRGAPQGNRNAAKIGTDLRWEMYLPKFKRTFLEEYFRLTYGRHPTEDELRAVARQIAYAAIDHALVEEFEKHPLNVF